MDTAKPFKQRSLREAARQGAKPREPGPGAGGGGEGVPPPEVASGNGASPPSAVSPPALKPEKKVKTKKVVAGTEQVARRCGCLIGVEFYSTDDEAMCEKRRDAVRFSVCPECKAARRTENQGRGRTDGRLPDGACFGPMTYDAAAQEWAGRLIVNGREFFGRASGLFRLCRTLDQMFRASPEGVAFAEAQQAKQT